MSASNRLARILATRSGRDVELAFATEDGRTVKVLASEDQIDRLVDELEDVETGILPPVTWGPDDRAGVDAVGIGQIRSSRLDVVQETTSLGS